MSLNFVFADERPRYFDAVVRVWDHLPRGQGRCGERMWFRSTHGSHIAQRPRRGYRWSEVTVALSATTGTARQPSLRHVRGRRMVNRIAGAREPCFDERCRVTGARDWSALSLRIPFLLVSAMTPGAFIAKWRAVELNERSASQSHFIDLCRLLSEPTPTDADPTGEWYCFERGARKDTGGDGWADVWKRGCFAWEYKGRHANLDTAFNQLRQYALALENPPLLIVSDMARFRIRTNWTNSVSETHEFALDDLADATNRDKLKWAMSEPERLRPGDTRQAVTERAAATFAELAQGLRNRGHDPQTVAHFVNPACVLHVRRGPWACCPATCSPGCWSVRGAIPTGSRTTPSRLFGAMASGGDVGFEPVAWFNGGLFDDDTALPLDREGVETALKAAALDWSEIDPSILGTLFERGLDPDKRSQLAAHYTDRDKIMRIVEPVIVRPLLAEWETAKAGIAGVVERADTAGIAGSADTAPAAGGPGAALLPRTAAELHRARSGLRFGELPLPRAARAQGHRAPGPASRRKGSGSSAGSRRSGRRT